LLVAVEDGVELDVASPLEGLSSARRLVDLVPTVLEEGRQHLPHGGGGVHNQEVL